MKLKTSWVISIVFAVITTVIGTATLWYMLYKASWVEYQILSIPATTIALAGTALFVSEFWFGHVYCKHAYCREPFFGKCKVIECRNKTVIEYDGWAYEFQSRPKKAESKSIVIEETFYYDIKKKLCLKAITKCWWE